MTCGLFNREAGCLTEAAERQYMLEARSLTKHYGYITAVRQVSFSIGAGEILGYLGPNGAGKSTTVKMLTGLIEPSEGQIFYKGRKHLHRSRRLSAPDRICP